MSRSPRVPARALAAVTVLLASMVFMTTLAAPAIHAGSRDIGALMLDAPDEHLIASGIYRMHLERTMHYRIGPYGGVYPYTAYLTTKPILRAVGVDEHNLVLALRWFSWVFALATMGILFGLTVTLTGSWAAGSIAAFVIALTPEFFRWGVRIHPDTLLLSLIGLTLLALVLAVRRGSQRWVDAAFVLAMLGFMTKLVGLFFLPAVALVQLHLDLRSRGGLDWRLAGRRLGRAALWGGVIVYVTTPTILVDSRAFFGGISKTVSVNHGGIGGASDPGLGWLSVSASPRLFGVALTVLFVLWSALLVPRLLVWLRHERWELRALEPAYVEKLAFGAFGIGFAGYLLATTRMYETRYAMPLLPTVAVSVAAMASGRFLPWPRLQGWLERAPRPARLAWVAIVLAALLLESPARFDAIEQQVAGAQLLDSDPRLAVGEWVASRFGPGARVIYDYGVYVPYSLEHAHKTFGLLPVQLEQHQPQVILVRDDRRALYLPEVVAQGGEPQQRRHRLISDTLARLEAGALEGFRPVRRFEEARVTAYAREDSEGCAPACSRRR